MLKNTRIILILAASVLLLTLAWVFRYEPMGAQGLGYGTVWDRWEHRTCVVWAGGNFNCFKSAS
jgi:hypothetical protein